MKVIYLIRHAESLLGTAPNDFDRPLSKKGLEDAKKMSNIIKGAPDIIISSSAERTKQTSLIFAATLHYPTQKIDFEPRIYEAPLINLIEKVNAISKKHNTALLVGHNPGITQLINYLCNDSFSPIPPCSIAKIELEIDAWNEVTQGIGVLDFLKHP